MPAASELPATNLRRSPIAILLIALAWLVAAAALALVAMRAMDPVAATIPVSSPPRFLGLHAVW